MPYIVIPSQSIGINISTMLNLLWYYIACFDISTINNYYVVKPKESVLE